MNVSVNTYEQFVKAIEAAAMFARDIGVQNVAFESDSLQVYSALQRVTVVSTAIANIIAGTLYHMHHTRHIEVRHTRREGNKAAHGLEVCPINR